jgi:hypothetical protein
MKKLLVLFLLAGYCITAGADEPTVSLVTGDAGKIDAKKVDVGATKVKVVLMNGEKKSIPIDQLKSYSTNGKEFRKLPMYKNGKPTGQTVFMELVKTRGDYSLYKYEYWDNDLIKDDKKVRTAFLFNNDEFQMQVDEKTLLNVCNFFGLTGVIE